MFAQRSTVVLSQLHNCAPEYSIFLLNLYVAWLATYNFQFLISILQFFYKGDKEKNILTWIIATSLPVVPPKGNSGFESQFFPLSLALGLLTEV